MIFLRILLVLAAMLAGCSKDIHTTEAVRQGVIDHLSSRQGLDLNLSAMEVEVSGVVFRENEVDATVSFRPRGSTGGAMQMRYTLERAGNQWKVKTSEGAARGSAEDPHGMGAQAPGGEMPAGHPPVETIPEPGTKQ